MDEPDNLSELVSQFAAVTGALPHEADHYLAACNYDLNRAVEFYFENPPASTQAGPGGSRGAARDDDEAAGLGAYRGNAGILGGEMAGGPTGMAADEDEELQRALAESMADAEPSGRGAGARPPVTGAGGTHGSRPRAAQPAVEVLDDEEDGDLPDADGMLAAMARLREASQAAEREARQRMEDTMDRMMAGVTGRPPVHPAFGDLPNVFPGMAGVFGPGMFPAGRGDEAAAARGRNASGGGGGAGQSQQRRRVEVRRPDEGGGGGSAAGRGGSSWDDDLELPEGMSRHELEEARMMEAAMLGVPYEGRLPDLTARGGGAGAYGGADADVAPEVLEHRELRWDQDRAYEESLAADRAKEQAAAKAKAEAEARERAQREAEEAATRAAAAEATRVAALVATKAARLPAEPSTSTSDAINVMVRLPDGSRHSRRFAPTDRLSSLFDFVDVELDTAAKAAAAPSGPDAAGASAASGGVADGTQATLKPGTYNLVAQFPRRVFSEAESGGKTFAEAGLAGGGGAAFFIEQTSS